MADDEKSPQSGQPKRPSRPPQKPRVQKKTGDDIPAEPKVVELKPDGTPIKRRRRRRRRRRRTLPVIPVTPGQQTASVSGPPAEVSKLVSESAKPVFSRRSQKRPVISEPEAEPELKPKSGQEVNSGNESEVEALSHVHVPFHYAGHVTQEETEVVHPEMDDGSLQPADEDELFSSVPKEEHEEPQTPQAGELQPAEPQPEEEQPGEQVPQEPHDIEPEPEPSEQATQEPHDIEPELQEQQSQEQQPQAEEPVYQPSPEESSPEMPDESAVGLSDEAPELSHEGLAEQESEVFHEEAPVQPAEVSSDDHDRTAYGQEEYREPSAREVWPGKPIEEEPSTDEPHAEELPAEEPPSREPPSGERPVLEEPPEDHGPLFGPSQLRIIRIVATFLIAAGLLYAGYAFRVYQSVYTTVHDLFFPPSPPPVTVQVDDALLREWGIMSALIFGHNSGSVRDLIASQIQNAYFFGKLAEPAVKGETGISAAYYYGLGKDSAYLENRFIFYVENLRDLQNLYDTDVYAMLDQTTHRTEKLDDYLNHARDLYQKSQDILREISLQNDNYKVSFNSLGPERSALEQDFFVSLQNFAGQKADFLLNSFIDAAQKQDALKARTAALGKLSGYYARAMSLLDTRIRAVENNREALIQGIHVVDIPGANLGIIIHQSS